MPADRRLTSVTRTPLAWSLVGPLLAAGLLAGHDLSYRLAISDPVQCAHYLAQTGHGYYLHIVPLLAAVAAALLGAGMGWRALAALRGSRGTTTPAWLFALLAPVAFTLQEHLERLLHDGVFPADLATQRVFLLGLALQVPFALGALSIARVLETIARATGRALGRVPVVSPHPPASLSFTRPLVAAARLRPLAHARSSRGPPKAAV